MPLEKVNLVVGVLAASAAALCLVGSAEKVKTAPCRAMESNSHGEASP